MAVGLGIAALGAATLTMDADCNKDGDAPAETAREVAALAASAQATVDGGVPMQAPAVASIPNSWTVPKEALAGLGGSQDLKVYGVATPDGICDITAESIIGVLGVLTPPKGSLPISKISIIPAAPHRPASAPGLPLPSSPGANPPCEQIMHVTRERGTNSAFVPILDGTGKVFMTINVNELPPAEQRKFGTFL